MDPLFQGDDKLLQGPGTILVTRFPTSKGQVFWGMTTEKQLSATSTYQLRPVTHLLAS